jgi:hypothetical protein
MSTILKTLRKLEEEKSILDQKLDLKGMLLKEDTAYPKSIKSERLKFFLLMTIVAGLLIAGGAVFPYWPSSQEVSSSRKHVLNKTPVQQPPPFKDLSRLRAFEGVPMAAISSNELASKPKPNKYLSSKQVAKLLPEEAPPISTSSGMEEIESLIRSTTALAKKKSAMLPTIQSGRIPGIKIKGIIFFDKDSSSNHIIATTESNSNVKLRVGEAVQDAILKSIHPNHVIFLYHDQLIEVGIGR